jgi:type II secretory pathway pseudopilin PulG
VLTFKLGGFTLAELLIALLILGEIATFTIPKIIMSQANTRNNAAAKEAMAMVSGAYQQYQVAQGAVPATAKFSDLTPYMNYVKVDTTSQLDDHVGANNNFDCSGRLCLRLHTGGVLFTQYDSRSFGGTSPTNAVLLYFDPDGTRTGTSTDGPGKSVGFFLYYNGAVTSRANVRPGTADSSVTHGASPSADPSWFSW